ncbi:formimidoylglutamase [Formosa sp. S-31]|uniref:formimidoylglutamase n=1 Tax=Formosa sp. S-31 TaxID=2790949 RepID=UPI003EBB7D88
MDKLVLFTESDLKALTQYRALETKFGENVITLSSSSNIYEQLKTLDVEYVLIGLPEDVGIFANMGVSGTSGAWHCTIKNLLNIQKNQFTNPNKLLILGHLNFDKELEKLQGLDQSSPKHISKAQKMVKKIDKAVTQLIFEITKAGKTPIIIGGGHNNAYGNIKGTALALNKPINAINLDAHSNFRQDKGRHSGNGFTFAYTEGFLKDYFIFGMHEDYTSENTFKTLNKLKHIQYNTYEDIEIKQNTSFKKELLFALNHIEARPFGIEIDVDAIQNVGSSAMTPSGFSVKKARQFVHFFGKHPQVKYLHISEAIPLSENDNQIAKLICYLITDFMRANSK